MVVFENVLSHTSTQKSPKYLNLHNLSAEFCFGDFFIGQNELGLETGWHKLSGDGFALFCGLMWCSKQWPKGPSPQGALFGVTLPRSSLHMQIPIFAWPMAVRVDVSKP